MSNFLPFYEQNGSDIDSSLDGIGLFNNSPKVKKPNTLLNTVLFFILLFIVIYYFYFMIYKKYKDFKKSSETVRTNNIPQNKQLDYIENQEGEDEAIDPSVLNTDYVDSNSFNFKLECSETECPQLSCDDNEIILRKSDQCCPECVNIGDDQGDNQDYQKRLEQLNQFVNKNISKIELKTDFDDIGRNTTKVTFSLIDRLSEFNYYNFSLEEFIKIFNREDEYIYIGIILLIIGLFFTIF